MTNQGTKIYTYTGLAKPSNTRSEDKMDAKYNLKQNQLNPNIHQNMATYGLAQSAGSSI